MKWLQMQCLFFPVKIKGQIWSTLKKKVSVALDGITTHHTFSADKQDDLMQQPVILQTIRNTSDNKYNLKNIHLESHSC